MRSTPHTITESIAAEVRAVCARKQIRQVDLAKDAGMSQAALSERLRGQRAFDIDQLERVCTSLGVDLYDILTSARSAA